MLRSLLVLSLGLSAPTACGGAASPLAEDEAPVARRAIPLAATRESVPAIHDARSNA
ncbi:MAG: hypothetical protein IPG50_15225 [Myxococcales bacterium]|nr:hypothetical protein [Myxococcales bacterium]